jgi:hypothetical protein
LSRDSLTIRTFPQSTFGMSGEASFGGALPHNGGPTGPKAWFVIANHMFNAYDEAHAYQPNPARNQPYKITLQWSLAHELEHLLGKNHIYRANGQRDDFRNPNTMQCSDVPNQPDW